MLLPPEDTPADRPATRFDWWLALRLFGLAAVAILAVSWLWPELFFDPVSRRIHDDPMKSNIVLIPNPLTAGESIELLADRLTGDGYHLVDRTENTVRYSKPVSSRNPFCGSTYFVLLTYSVDGQLTAASGSIAEGCL